MAVMRKLGKSGLQVSTIGLGCWAIGGPSWNDLGDPVGWSGNDDKASLEGLHKGCELGINHWDTADVYGKGHSERLIGRALKDGIRREDLIIASKVGWHKGTADNAFDPINIRHQLEQSLSNLGTDYLDIYYFHNPMFGENDFYLEAAAEEFNRLKSEGKFRVTGQSASTLDDFRRVCPVTNPEVIQLPFNAIRSPFDTEEKNVFKWADEKDLGIVMFGSYAKGLLLGKYDPNNPPGFEQGDIRRNIQDFKKENLQKLQPVLDALRQRFGSSQSNLAVVANQYALSRSKNAVTIPGFKNADQVIKNADTMEHTLSGEDIKFIAEKLQVFK